VTINNIRKFTECLWDWGVLNGCFADGCKVSDVDGRLERRGEFLDIEAKSPGVGISNAQARTFNRYLENGHHTALILWGEAGQYRNRCLWCGSPTSADKEPPAPTHMQVWPNDPVPCDLNFVQNFVHQWFRWADDRRVPLIGGARPRLKDGEGWFFDSRCKVWRR
jgi:hypothetical protein